MAMQVSTLRPGLLVSLKTSVTGNVKYNKQVIEGEHTTDDGESRASWQTERVVSDAAEFDKARKTRNKARAIISGVCAQSDFGMLCPDTAEDKLEKSIAEARKMAEEFNSTSKLTRVRIYVITGRIAPDDVEAIRAINSEVRGLIEDMAEGMKNLDAKVIRDAASRALKVGNMLSLEAATRVQMAVNAARATARDIIKAGEQGVATIDGAAVRFVTEQRTAFLDLDDAREVGTPTESGRAVDFAPGSTVKLPKQAAPAMEV